MQSRVFTIHDQAANAFLPPFVVPSAGLALRIVANAVQTPDHDFNKYPSQYELFEIGAFDCVTGHIIPMVSEQSHGTVGTIARRVADANKTEEVL